MPGDVRPTKLLLRALAGQRTERPPIWLMRQAGRYLPEYHRVREAAGGMVGLCNSPEHAVEVTLQPIRRFPLDAAILFADLPQVAAALGQTLDYRAGDGPVLTPPVRSTADMRSSSASPASMRNWHRSTRRYGSSPAPCLPRWP